MGANLSDIPAKDSDSDNHQQRERKKRWWRRRNSKSFDPGKPFRELMTGWSFSEILSLVQDYEVLSMEKELFIQSESARQAPPNVKSDLADLLDFKYNSDINLILPPAIFPAHRSILMQRSKYFRNLISRSQGSTNVNVDLSVDIPTFSSLIRYLYTEESINSSSSSSIGLLLEQQLPDRLQNDLRDLLMTGKYSDVCLVIGDEQFPAHKSILAARSPFFRNLLHRRSTSSKIILDESVINKRFVRALLHCMYTDKLDLSTIDPARTGLTEVESLTVNGRLNPAGFEEAMELYQIARFLEFDMLAQLSEDIIIDSLNIEILPGVMKWANCPHGSSYVRRQALLFLREEFVHLINSPSFLDLSRSTLMELVQSDFLQASELDVLTAIVKWGENQLMKRVEDREPNILTTTRDSVTRKGIKRRDLSDIELKEIIGDLLCYVRTEHILNADALASHVRRGLISLPPSNLMLADKYNPWLTTRPRLYMPFYDEARTILRSTCGTEVTARRGNLRLFIPDALYMVDDHQQEQNQVDDEQQMVIDPEILTAMKYREAKLRAANSRALTVSRDIVSKYIRLRVVREFGFPDTVTSLLEDKMNSTQTSLTEQPKEQSQVVSHSLSSQHPQSSSQQAPSQISQEPMMPDICGATDSPKFNEELFLDLGLGDDKYSASLGRNRPRQKNPHRDQRVYSTLRYASITPPPPHYL